MQNTLYYTFPVPHNVFEEEKFRKYRPSIKLVYVWLLKLHNHFADEERWFFRSGETLSKEIGIDIKTYWAAQKQLLEDGYIEVRKGKYNPETNTRHAFWYKVNGFMNKGEQNVEVSQKNEQADPQEKGIVSRETLDRKFGKDENIFDWLIESGLMEKLSETKGRIVATDGHIQVAVGKAYAGIYDALTKFLLNA